MAADATDYITEQDFCARYRIAPRTAQRWRREGRFGPPYIRAGGRRVLYRLADCEAWAAAQRFRTRAEEIANVAAE
jgi:predicted site-specific integrase-resolvase